MSALTTLFATILGYPEPADALSVARVNETASRLLTTWRLHMPTNPEDGHGDTEDFWEQAARLTAALESGADQVWLHPQRTSEPARLIHSTVPQDDTDVIFPGLHEVAVQRFHGAVSEGTVLHYGPLTLNSPLQRVIDHRADRYHHSSTFADYAGRTILPTGFNLHLDTNSEASANGSPVETADALAALAEAGHTHAIVKAGRAKHGIWKIPTSTSPQENAATLTRALGWSLIHVEGTPGALIVQPYIPMRYEYRIFIVGGVPVTGAGCIEEHTPLDADPTQPFSPLMRAQRPIRFSAWEEDLDDPSGTQPTLDPSPTVDPIENRPTIVQRYIDVAHAVAQTAAERDEFPTAYTIDLASTLDGHVLVIEMNGHENSGLYATHPWLVAQALVGVHAKDRRSRGEAQRSAEDTPAPGLPVFSEEQARSLLERVRANPDAIPTFVHPGQPKPSA